HSLLRRGPRGTRNVPARGQISVLRADPRLAAADRADLDALSGGIAEPGAADLRRHQEPVPRLAGRVDHQFPARTDAVGVHFRSAQRAVRGSCDRLGIAADALRRGAANAVSRRQCARLAHQTLHNSVDGRDRAVRVDPQEHKEAARMKATLHRIAILIRKELIAVLKDPRSRIVLVMPVILQSLLFGYAATFDLDEVPYALLDTDRS